MTNRHSFLFYFRFYLGFSSSVEIWVKYLPGLDNLMFYSRKVWLLSKCVRHPGWAFTFKYQLQKLRICKLEPFFDYLSDCPSIHSPNSQFINQSGLTELSAKLGSKSFLDTGSKFRGELNMRNTLFLAPASPSLSLFCVCRTFWWSKEHSALLL